MKVLITGGCGFIGSNLIEYLDKKGHSLRILDNYSSGSKNYLKTMSLEQAPQVIVGDVRNEKDANKAAAGVDVVVHLAAHTNVVESLKSPREDWDTNVNGTFNMLEACRHNHVNKFIFASSTAVLGNKPSPIEESILPEPISPYGASKLAGEGICYGYFHSFDLKTVVLRFANCYGLYSDHKANVTTLFMNRLKKGKPVTIYGDGEQTRDFVHAEDVCQAISAAMDAANDAPIYGQIFQIGSGQETSIKELARMLGEITGCDLPPDYEPERRGEILRNYSDISKAREMLGFSPDVDLREGLDGLWHWFTVR